MIGCCVGFKSLLIREHDVKALLPKEVSGERRIWRAFKL